MWGSLVLLSGLTIFSSSSWEAAALPALAAPSSLRTGNASHKAVWLEWEFRETEDLKISDVLFLVTLEAEPRHERREHRLRYKTTELSFSFEDLVPGKVYVASVVATNPNWLDSLPSQISFTTMEKDWSTPKISSVIRTPRRDIAQYSVTWSELPSPGLTHVAVEVCDSHCVSYTQETTAVSTLVTVKFDSRFLIRICAFYKADVVGLIERCSRYFQGRSASAPPERLLSMKNVKTVGNRIRLDWHPLLPSDGPVSYYEVFVRDPSMRSPEPEFDVEEEEEEYKFSLRVLAVTDTDFELRFLDDEFERMLQYVRANIMTLSDAENFQPEPLKQNEPLQLKIIRKTKSTLRFRILFRSDDVQWVQLDETIPKHLILGAKNFTFSPSKPIDFLIRTCLTYKDDGIGVCGNLTASRIINSVNEPSPVPFIGYEFKSPKKLEVFWQAPKEPRGPIDGYKLRIQTKYEDGIETRILTLAPHIRSFLIEDPTGEVQYHIGIAAFNVDKENNNEQLEGMWVYLTPVKSHVNVVLLVFTIATCATVIALFITTLFNAWRVDQERIREQETVEAERTMVSVLRRSLPLESLSG